MIYHAWALALALIAAPAAAQPALPSPTPKPPAACGEGGPYDSGADDDKLEPACLAVLGPLAKRDRATLTLALANGATKTFTNEGKLKLPDTEPTRWETHFSLVAYEAAAQVFVVQGPDGLLAVDGRDGRETAFKNDFPHFAPGGVLALTIAKEGTGVATIRDTSARPAKVVWESTRQRNRRFIAWDDDHRVRLLVEDNAIALVARDAAGRWTTTTTAMKEPKIEAPPTCMPDPIVKDRNLAACFAELDGMVIDNGSLLSLQLENGHRKRFVGRITDDDTVESYGLVGFDPLAHAYVVRLGFYEGHNLMIEDSRTGAETDLGDDTYVPYFAPDRRHFLVTSSGDTETTFGGTDVSIFSWDPKSGATTPKSIWTHEISDQPFGIEKELGWDGDRRFGLQLADGRKAVVSQDDKGAWHFEAFGTPKPAEPPLPAPLRACGPHGTFTIVDRDDYEKDCLAANGGRISRTDQDVALMLDDGTLKRFATVNDPKTGSIAEQFFPIAYEPDAHMIVLEGFETIVAVDVRTGREQRFATFPFYAPDGVVALTIDPNTAALTMFDTRITPPKPVWRDAPPDHPKPYRNIKLLAWDSDRRARLLVEDTEVAFLVRDAAGAWHYDTIAMDEPVIDDPPTCMPGPGPKPDDPKACLAKLDGMIIDNGTLHSLRLEDGTRKRLVDDLREGWTTWTRYVVEGFDPKHHVYVVHEDYYEGSGGEILVDTRTGREIELGSGAQAPYFSPDGKHLIYLLSGDQENNGAGTELHLWDWDPKPKEIWSKEIADDTYQVESMTGWAGDKRFGLELADGRKALVSQDDKGTWHYEAFGAPKPKPADQP